MKSRRLVEGRKKEKKSNFWLQTAQTLLGVHVRNLLGVVFCHHVAAHLESHGHETSCININNEQANNRKEGVQLDGRSAHTLLPQKSAEI